MAKAEYMPAGKKLGLLELYTILQLDFLVS